MSNRSLVEINHDFCPENDKTLVRWATCIRTFIRSGDPTHLPHGVTFKSMRHHSEPDPMQSLASTSGVAEKLAEALALSQRSLKGNFKDGWTVWLTGHEMVAVRAALAAYEDAKK